ncbi:hypothetical protein [Streptomyces adustus]|uniref:hypothetical protein n=1 Tax=Streptomyces adustus TaxID=1609272 RepID=UPI00192E6E43
MAPDSGDIWHENPFPLIPVVRLGPASDLGDPSVRGADSGNAHITTPLVRDLRALVDDYFAPPAAPGRRGRAIALVGGFGLGKSHALRRTYQTVRERHSEAAMWIVDEPAQDMGRLYRDRLRGPGDSVQGRQAFEELVRDYYAYVTAGWVGAQEDDPRRDTLQEIATGLRERALDPDKVVAALRYDPEVIHADLRGTLGEVTEHRRFATALALLLEPPFKRMVWNWLGGEEPAEPLRERGITEAIGPSGGGAANPAGIDRVFDALAVQGFLHGRVGTAYVLLLDSLEKVLDWPEENRRTFMDAFERLVNIYTSHGGLLVFCTSPEGLRALRAGMHERVVQLWPTGLSDEHTRELVAKYLAASRENAGTAPDTGPFEEEALRLLHELTEGVPREVLKVCRQAWQLSEEPEEAPEFEEAADAGAGGSSGSLSDSGSGSVGGSENGSGSGSGSGAATGDHGGADGGRRLVVRRVTGATVLKAVRELHERVSYRKVLDDVHDALDLGQWRIASRDPVPARLSRSPGGRDEVVHWLSPAPNAYIAVVHTRSVLLADDAERIAAHVHGLRSAVRPGRFEALLLVNGLVSQAMQDRLGRSIGSRPLVYRQGGFAQTVHEALLQLERRLVEEQREGDLAELGERMRRDLEQQQAAQLEELRRAVAALALENVPRGTVPATAVPGGEPEPETPELPVPVRRRFRDALAMLETVTRRVAGRAVNRRVAATPADLSVLGCATLVRELTEDFRGSVSAWARGALPGAPTEHQLSELRRICREYECAVEVLPVHLLGGAEPQHPLTPARAVEILAEEVWGSLSAVP